MAKKVIDKSNVFQNALDELNKKYGVGTIVTLEDEFLYNYDVISSGSIGMDHIALGIGGFAKGKLYELMGWESSGKSTICGHAAAECQKKGGTVLYIDGEHAFDKTYFQALGVDISKLLISQPDHGEQGFNIAIRMLETGNVDLVIIDSDNSLIPKKQLDGEVGDSVIGVKARLNSSAYPKLKTALSKHNACGIVISQYREKIGVMFGNPTTTAGGHTLKFYSDCRIEVSRSLAKDGDVNYGNITKIKSIKNKMSPPYKKCDFEIVYGKGIDKFQELIQLSSEYGIGKLWGKTFTINNVKYNLDEFKQMVLEDEDFYNELKQKVVEEIHKITVDAIEEDI